MVLLSSDSVVRDCSVLLLCTYPEMIASGFQINEWDSCAVYRTLHNLGHFTSDVYYVIHPGHSKLSYILHFIVDSAVLVVIIVIIVIIITYHH